MPNLILMPDPIILDSASQVSHFTLILSPWIDFMCLVRLHWRVNSLVQSLHLYFLLSCVDCMCTIKLFFVILLLQMEHYTLTLSWTVSICTLKQPFVFVLKLHKVQKCSSVSQWNDFTCEYNPEFVENIRSHSLHL